MAIQNITALRCKSTRWILAGVSNRNAGNKYAWWNGLVLWIYIVEKKKHFIRNSITHNVGTGVKIADDRMDLMKKMYRAENFNVMASNMMSLQRSLDDMRHPDCKTINYPARLPKASIIIVFHNEVWSTLIRTIWSIINRTPKQLLEEIILVDDLSTRAYLRHELNQYLDPLPVTVKIIRTRIRQGLVRARVKAADVAAVRWTCTFFQNTRQQMNSLFTFFARVKFWYFWIRILNALRVGWSHC